MDFLAWLVPLLAFALAAPQAIWAQGVSPRTDVWQPNGPITTLAEANGIIYFGGEFSWLSPPGHDYAGARPDPILPMRLPWNRDVIYPPNADPTPRPLPEGLRRTKLAAIDAATGCPTDWTPSVDFRIGHLAAGNGVVFVAGRIENTYDRNEFTVCAISSSADSRIVWRVPTHGQINALTLMGEILYVGGYFTSIDGHARKGIAALDAATGRFLDQQPGVDGSVFALSGVQDTLYVAGLLSTSDGRLRCPLVAVDSRSGAPKPWEVTFEDGDFVMSMASTGDTLYIAGDFRLVDGLPRHQICAVDRHTGKVTDWVAQTNVYSHEHINILALSESGLWVGGNISFSGGKKGVSFAVLDPANAQPIDWEPDPVALHSPYCAVPVGQHALAAAHPFVPDGPFPLSLYDFPPAGQNVPDLGDRIRLPDLLGGLATGWGWSALDAQRAGHSTGVEGQAGDRANPGGSESTGARDGEPGAEPEKPMPPIGGAGCQGCATPGRHTSLWGDWIAAFLGLAVLLATNTLWRRRTT